MANTALLIEMETAIDAFKDGMGMEARMMLARRERLPNTPTIDDLQHAWETMMGAHRIASGKDRVALFRMGLSLVAASVAIGD